MPDIIKMSVLLNQLNAMCEFASTMKLGTMAIMASHLIPLCAHLHEALWWSLNYLNFTYSFFSLASAWLRAKSGGGSLSEQQFNSLFSLSMVPQAVLGVCGFSKRMADFLLRFPVVVIQFGHFTITNQFSGCLVKRLYYALWRCGNLNLEPMDIP